jgi:hypothetical protein
MIIHKNLLMYYVYVKLYACRHICYGHEPCVIAAQSYES